MRAAPVTPARIEFGPDASSPPRAPDFGDVYHPVVGAVSQAQHVFLHGNGLPARWADRPDFTVLETGFGLGNNFLATWQAWRNDPARGTRLHYVALELHPPTRDDLACAHAASPWPALAAALLRGWPPAVAGLHVLDFDDGRVRLLLALGDAGALLPSLTLAADAVYLDGFAQARNAVMWSPRLMKSLARKLAPGATAATWSVARELRDGLAAAGFEVQRAPGIGGKRDITQARWAPRFVPRGPAPALPRPSGRAFVVGAGLAGAAVAQALARQGVAVTVLDRLPQPAGATSGNAAGIFHATVHGDDGVHARLFRSAARLAAREFRAAVAVGVPGQVDGLLRLHVAGDGSEGNANGIGTGGAGRVEAMQARLARLGLPAAVVQALDAAAASARAGRPLPAAAWWHADGGWISPPAWVAHTLATPGVEFLGGVEVAALRRDGAGWALLDTAGRLLGSAEIVVLANAGDASRLLAPLGDPAWPLSHSRGQVTRWSPPSPLALALPVAGDGYALRLPDGSLLCGATRETAEPPDDATNAAEAAPRDADHQHNLQRLQRLLGLPAVPDAMGADGSMNGHVDGRVGWRLQSADRLPVAGAVPALGGNCSADAVVDQVRRLAREPGLFVLTALGARGLTLAPLLARLVAAQATGTPWPLEQDLADAVDPGRWRVRAVRASASKQAERGCLPSKPPPQAVA